MKTDLAESGILTVAVRPERTAEVLSLVKPEDFSDKLRPIFQAIKNLFDANEAIDLITVAEEMERAGHENPLPAIVELFELTDYSCAANLPTYAKKVREGALYRRLNIFLGDARQMLTNDQPEAAYQRIMSALTSMGETGDNQALGMREAARRYIEIMQERAESDGKLIGLSTGFDVLDERTGGMRPGDLIVIAARPSMGKTTLLLNIMEFLGIKQRRPTLLFTMEMPSDQILEKQTASLGEISIKSLRSGMLTSDEWNRFAVANKLISNSPQVIDDRGGLNLSQVRARCFEIQRRQGLEIVGIDYLQLMEGEGENRNQVVSDITRGLKALAKDLKCPIIVLSQLNRGLESRQDKRPRNSDLRESGAIEQDADMIIFPYRDEMYNENSPWKNTAQIIFGKQRMGAIGSDGLGWEGQYSRFVKLDYRPKFDVQPEPIKNKARGMQL